MVGRVGLVGCLVEQNKTKHTRPSAGKLTLTPPTFREKFNKPINKNFSYSQTHLRKKITKNPSLSEQRTTIRALNQLDFTHSSKYGSLLYSSESKLLKNEYVALVTEILHRPEDVFYLRKKK